jgi:hypothetical protein
MCIAPRRLWRYRAAAGKPASASPPRKPGEALPAAPVRGRLRSSRADQARRVHQCFPPWPGSRAPNPRICPRSLELLRAPKGSTKACGPGRSCPTSTESPSFRACHAQGWAMNSACDRRAQELRLHGSRWRCARQRIRSQPPRPGWRRLNQFQNRFCPTNACHFLNAFFSTSCAPWACQPSTKPGARCNASGRLAAADRPSMSPPSLSATATSFR